MAYGVVPYRVDIDAVSDAYGTAHDDVKSAIIRSCESHGFFESLDRNFPTDLGWTGAKGILSEYLNGTLKNASDNAKTWYVIEALVQGYGKTLSNAHWYPGNIDSFYDYEEFRMYLISRNRSVDFESSNTGFPTVFTIENKNLKKAAERITNDYSSAMAAEFKSWTAKAIENNQDLVLFYY